MHITWDTFKKNVFFCLNCLYHWRKVRRPQSTPQNTSIEHKTRWKMLFEYMKMDTFEKLKTIQIWAIQSFWNVFKFLKIFPKMGFSLLMTQMKSKNFSFDRVWAMSIVKYIFFSISTEKNDKKKFKSFHTIACRGCFKKIVKTDKKSNFFICPILIIQNTSFFRNFDRKSKIF